MKKGFTLIELLAVIIVLAIVALIATPIVLNVIEDSKKTTAESEANLVLSGLTSYCNSEDFKIEAGTLTEKERKCKEEITEETIKELVPNISSTTKIEEVKYENGKITSLKVESNGHKFELNENGTMYEKNEEPEQEGYAGANPCTYSGELTQGAEYANGQYTYRYMQEDEFGSWNNIEKDGWGVTLTDKSSTDAVTTPLCSSISGKPIVSMSSMFAYANAVSIDLSNFDTSNVTNMYLMFYTYYGDALDVSNFNTSNVTNMSAMFYSEGETVAITGLTSFDTGNVTNMSDMFNGLTTTSLDLSSFDTSNVTNMSGMFGSTQATTAYARNAEEADRFNNADVTIIDGFTFQVK